MWTPLSETREEGWQTAGIVYPSEEETTLGPALPQIEPGDWMILGKVFERKKPRQIAEEMGVSVGTVNRVLGSKAFQAAVELVESRIADRIARGEFGVLAIAKANAVAAMRRIVGMSKHCHNEMVRFKANDRVLEIAGVQPPKPVEQVHVERLMDRFTLDEAKEFYQTGHFPARFADQLARIAVAQVDEAERKRWVPAVDGHEIIEGADLAPVERPPPVEEVEP